MDWQAVAIECAKIVGLALFFSFLQLSFVVIMIRTGWAFKVIIWVKRRFFSGSDEGALNKKAED